jgi:hypothetical protein
MMKSLINENPFYNGKYFINVNHSLYTNTCTHTQNVAYYNDIYLENIGITNSLCPIQHKILLWLHMWQC